MPEAPDATTAILAAIDDQRERIRSWADAEMTRLDRAAAALGKPKAATPPAARKAPPKRTRNTTSHVEAAKRREAVLAFLVERGGMVPSREIREAVGISKEPMRTAVKRLEEEGKVRRRGSRQTTEYGAVGSGAPLAERAAAAVGKAPGPDDGTLQGRVLSKVQAGGFVSHASLLESTGASEADLRRATGLLIREEEIRMERREGQPGYIVAP
jgi:hypothetical protein